MVRVKEDAAKGSREAFQGHMGSYRVRPVFKIKVFPSRKAGPARSEYRVDGVKREEKSRLWLSVSLQMKTCCQFLEDY